MSLAFPTAVALGVGVLLAPLGFVLGASTYAMSLTIEDRISASPLDRVLGKLAYSVVGSVLGLLMPLATWQLYQASVRWL